MEFLRGVLGIHVVYRNEVPKPQPNFISARYRMKKVLLDGKEVVFLYPKKELDSVDAIRKHIDRIQKTEGMPIVLVSDHLTYRQKEYLLRDRIPFIVEGKQIYLPFMAIYLQERADGERLSTEVMLPSAQLLLLYYIYHGCGELLTSEVSKALGFTPTSISRASRQLAEMNLINTQKRGVQKVIFSDRTPKELFAAAEGYLNNPVKRIIYVPKTEIKEKLLLSGYSALSEYSLLNPPPVSCFAAGSVAKWEAESTRKLQNANEQCAVELWRYDPKRLTQEDGVDRLSLALSLREDGDERVEEAIDVMLGQVWRDIDGKGH